jgi:hypothetical protein
MLHRDDVIRTLYQFAHAAIRGQAPWPARRETNEALYAMLLEVGLIREVDGPDGYEGSFVIDDGIELLTFVIGYRDPYEFPGLTIEDWHELERLQSEEAVLAAIKARIFTAYAGPSGACQ